jgi:hypothetical protein
MKTIAPCASSGLPADWLDLLPPPLIPLVVWPRRSERFCDAAVPAERCIGYDSAGALAFCVSRHLLSRLVSADDAEFAEEPEWSECVTAWRLREGGWIVHRSVRRWEGCRQTGQDQLYLSASMPR